MNWARYLSGVFAALSAIGVGIALEGDARFLFVPAAWIVIFGGTAGLLAASFPARQLFAGLRVAAGDLERTTPEERELALLVLSAAMRYPSALGAMCALFSVVGALRTLSEASTLGPHMATALVGPLYALFVAELFVAPLWFRVAAGTRGPAASAPLPRPPIPFAAIAMAVLCLIWIMLLMMTLEALR